LTATRNNGLTFFPLESHNSLDQVNTTPMVKAPNLRCLEERQRRVSFFLHWIISRSISVKPIRHWLHPDAWCKHWRSSLL